MHDVAGRFADASAADAAKGIGYLFVFLLYLAILLNAQAIMASVAEEKTSRIAELLVATIDPAQLLTAKILASAATGMIQLAVWVATGALAGSAVVGMFSDSRARRAGAGIGPLALPPGEVLSFVAFFIVGFLQYGVLYAGRRVADQPHRGPGQRHRAAGRAGRDRLRAGPAHPAVPELAAT